MMNLIIKLLKPFAIKRHERCLAVLATLVMMALNALEVVRYHKWLHIPLGQTKHYVKEFQLSGFDPLTYQVIDTWWPNYNVYRHPLLAFFMYPFHLLNRGLSELTGLNCTVLVVALLLTLNGVYGVLFFRRLFNEVVGVSRRDGTLLAIYLWSMAYVMVSAMAPDHFAFSMTFLLLTLYVVGRQMRSDGEMSMASTIGLFVLTAGASLNNGLKVLMSALLANGRRFFRWRFFLFAALLPCLLMWLFAKWEYRTYVWPQEMARKAKKKAAAEKAAAARAAKPWADEKKEQGVKKDEVVAQQQHATKGRTLTPSPRKKKVDSRTGRPFVQGEFMRWSDATTPRVPSIVHNMLGEGVQLHRQHLLQDEFAGRRPMFVHYESAFNYVVEALVVLLFVIGVWMGRRDRVLWMALSFAAFDWALHLGLGFGLNEVYIMSAHWLFVLPLATAYLFKRLAGKWLLSLRIVVALLALFLWVWNGSLLLTYML